MLLKTLPYYRYIVRWGQGIHRGLISGVGRRVNWWFCPPKIVFVKFDSVGNKLFVQMLWRRAHTHKRLSCLLLGRPTVMSEGLKLHWWTCFSFFTNTPRSAAEQWIYHQMYSGGSVDFAQISYRLWSRDAWCHELSRSTGQRSRSQHDNVSASKML